jgi:hypothetical protein
LPSIKKPKALIAILKHLPDNERKIKVLKLQSDERADASTANKYTTEGIDLSTTLDWPIDEEYFLLRKFRWRCRNIVKFPSHFNRNVN